MSSKKQKKVSERFEEMFEKGITPWTDHDPEPLLEEFANNLKAKKPDAKVLDIGCGDGWISIKLAKLGFSVSGIDSSQTAIKRAKKSADSEGLDVDFRVGDALNLPFEDKKFDAIIDRGLLHHILPENRGKYYENIKRVLKKEGLVYLSVFSKRNKGSIGQTFKRGGVKKLFKDFEIVKFAKDPWPSHNPAHLLHFVLKRED